MNLNISVTISTDLISTKLATKHPWEKGIQVCANEGGQILLQGRLGNYEIDKLTNFKNLLQYQDPFISNLTQASLGLGYLRIYK